MGVKSLVQGLNAASLANTLKVHAASCWVLPKRRHPFRVLPPLYSAMGLFRFQVWDLHKPMPEFFGFRELISNCFSIDHCRSESLAFFGLILVPILVKLLHIGDHSLAQFGVVVFFLTKILMAYSFNELMLFIGEEFVNHFDDNTGFSAGMFASRRKSRRSLPISGGPGALPRKILDFCLLKMRFLAIFVSFVWRSAVTSHETLSNETNWSASRCCNCSPQGHSWGLSTVREEGLSCLAVSDLKKIFFFNFFEMFSCISLLEAQILTMSFNWKKPSGHNERVDLRKETAFVSMKIFFPGPLSVP